MDQLSHHTRELWTEESLAAQVIGAGGVRTCAVTF